MFLNHFFTLDSVAKNCVTISLNYHFQICFHSSSWLIVAMDYAEDAYAFQITVCERWMPEPLSALQVWHSQSIWLLHKKSFVTLYKITVFKKPLLSSSLPTPLQHFILLYRQSHCQWKTKPCNHCKLGTCYQVLWFLTHLRFKVEWGVILSFSQDYFLCPLYLCRN